VVLKGVLAAIDRTKHIRPIIYTDAELPFLAEEDAAGISAYRNDLQSILADRIVRQLPHEEIISKLDAAGRTFRVLLLKTTFLLPYTSVFFELDCGYWSSSAEERLRKTLTAR
jgi:hypothetical protein